MLKTALGFESDTPNNCLIFVAVVWATDCIYDPSVVLLIVFCCIYSRPLILSISHDDHYDVLFDLLCFIVL